MEYYYIFRFITKLKDNVFSIVSIWAEYFEVFFLQCLWRRTRDSDGSNPFFKKIGRWKLTILSKYLLSSLIRKSTSENTEKLH
jgi:hypothetical protein